MEQRRQVTLLGDSILKGIQVDLGSRRYKPQNEMNVDALESELLESEPALLEPPQAARLNTMAAAITKAKTFFFIWNLLFIKILTNVI